MSPLPSTPVGVFRARSEARWLVKHRVLKSDVIFLDEKNRSTHSWEYRKTYFTTYELDWTDLEKKWSGKFAVPKIPPADWTKKSIAEAEALRRSAEYRPVPKGKPPEAKFIPLLPIQSWLLRTARETLRFRSNAR